MFVTPTIFGVSQRVVATLVACAVVMLSIGFYTTAQAANLTNISNVLSDSDVSVVSDHTITFTIPTGSAGVAAGQTITVDFPAGFAMGSVAFGDIDFSIDTVDQTLAATPSGATWGAAVAGQTLTLTSGTGVVVADEVVEIQVGTNAAGGTNQVTNPTAGSYEFVVTAGPDTGKTRVAIIDNVLVTAIIETAFDFTITGLATSTAVNGENTTGSTSPTAIPFGVLTAGAAEFLAQQLNVTTNAANGFVVTVEKDAPLQSSTGADIDDFVDASGTDTPTAWASPNGTLAFGENGWGHWGMVAVDGNLQGAGTNFTATDQFVAASSSPRAVFAHNGPSDGTTTGGNDATTDDIGQTIVGYKIEVTALQEAGDDYNTTLTYIATPTF